ncbi:MAG: hypothetical protein ACP5P4_10545 [Steroidobacteraceae bacterium]
MLIGLLGLKGSGKDTAAAMLAELGFKRMAFADALYAEVARAYEVTPHFLGRRDTKETPLERLALKHCRDARFVGLFTDAARGGRSIEEVESPRSPRWVLQQWGTEYRRNSEWGYEGYWVDPVMRKIDAMPPGSRIVLTDVRSLLEVQGIRACGGALVRIRRRKVDEDDAFAVAAGLVSALHSSEMLARTCKVDFEIENVEGDPGAMRRELETFLTGLRPAA